MTVDNPDYFEILSKIKLLFPYLNELTFWNDKLRFLESDLIPNSLDTLVNHLNYTKGKPAVCNDILNETHFVNFKFSVQMESIYFLYVNKDKKILFHADSFQVWVPIIEKLKSYFTPDYMIFKGSCIFNIINLRVVNDRDDILQRFSLEGVSENILKGWKYVPHLITENDNATFLSYSNFNYDANSVTTYNAACYN